MFLFINIIKMISDFLQNSNPTSSSSLSRDFCAIVLQKLWNYLYAVQPVDYFALYDYLIIVLRCFNLKRFS